jgi:hypothetical protein
MLQVQSSSISATTNAIVHQFSQIIYVLNLENLLEQHVYPTTSLIVIYAHANHNKYIILGLINMDD